MAMPAVRAFHAQHPQWELTLLVKRKMIPLWELCTSVRAIMELEEGALGAWRTAQVLRQEGFDRCYILGNSFRSALTPFLAGIPDRIAFPGHHRDFMLTEVIPGDSSQDQHQAHEMAQLLGIALPDSPTIDLEIPPGLPDTCRRHFLDDTDTASGRGPWIALLPGAARGNAKRWPLQHFVECGQRIRSDLDAPIVIMGAAQEHALCEEIAQGIGCRVHNLAGVTSLQEFAAILSLCRGAIANDSGGMHLAAATGTPLVALFGLTSPEKTGPLSPCKTVLRGVENGHRDIARDSSKAQDVLASISPDAAYTALSGLLEGRS